MVALEKKAAVTFQHLSFDKSGKVKRTDQESHPRGPTLRTKHQ